MRFPVKDALTEKELEAGLRSVVKDGLTSQAMATLTGGPFIVALALALGAPNIAVGLLSAIPLLVQLIQIPSIYLVERFKVRRAICVGFSSAGRAFWLLVAVIPLFVLPPGIGLIWLIVAILMQSSIGAVSACSWNSWMRDLVPQHRLGVFFGKRMALATAVGIPLGLVGALGLDYWKAVSPDSVLLGYSLLYVLGFLVGMLGVYFISTIPEPRLTVAEEKPQFRKMLLEPFKDGNFKNLVIFLAIWAFAGGLAAPFFAVYMLVALHLPLALVMALTVLNQFVSVLFLRVWGRLSDRLSNKSVLRVCGPLFMLCVVAWPFTLMPEVHLFTLPLLFLIHVFLGVATAGVSLASGNIALKLAPAGNATRYLAANSFVNSLAAGIAPIIAGLLADLLIEQQFSWTFNWISPGGTFTLLILHLQRWDFLFVLAFLIGVYSIHRLALVREEGEVKERVVLQALLSEVRGAASVFSVTGLRSLTRFPSLLRRGPSSTKRDMSVPKPFPRSHRTDATPPTTSSGSPTSETEDADS
jgi:MFS family permease